MSRERLHYLRSLFAQHLGYVCLPTLIKGSDAFYDTKQFAVNGDNFITWAYLSDDAQFSYLCGQFDWLDSDITKGNLWLIEAKIYNGIPFAKASLKSLSNKKYARFISKGKLRKIRLI